MWGLGGVGVLGLVLGVFWLSCCVRVASADIVLIGRNITHSFSTVDANFAPTIGPSGVRGMLYLAEPLDACSELTNKVEGQIKSNPPFVLIVRGGCSTKDKVRRAQEAGFKAAIVYNNEDNEDCGLIVAMSGNSTRIKIHAVFISKPSGETLKTYAGSTDIQLLILPSGEYIAYSIMVYLFISVVAMSVVLATYFSVRRHRVRREHPQGPHVGEFHGMSSHLVKAIPSLVFTSVLEDNCTSRTCAICIEDYIVGDKLRILPCSHKYHALCVDAWLKSWKTFCPVCKRDARIATGEPPASESTPLLSSNSASMVASLILSTSTRSSIAIPIIRESFP